MPSTVSLPMYDLVELREHHDALWSAVRTRLAALGLEVPAQLSHQADVHGLWHAPDLVISQACGWPLVDELDGRVRTIGAFGYDVPTADGRRYRSRVVMATGRTPEALDTLVAGVNSFASLSGWLSLVRSFPELDGAWPGRTVDTGAHVESLAALRRGEIDIAAIDGVTLELVRRHRPHLLDGVAIVRDGPLIPCLPIIAARDTTDQQLDMYRSAFAAAVGGDLDRRHLEALLITSFHPVGSDAYDEVRPMAVAAS